jgi:hypothetical protein
MHLKQLNILRISALLTTSLTGALVWAAGTATNMTTPGAEYFEHNVKPIFESRCIQCHSCYNSPCQLKLDSVEGLDRGLVKGFDVFTPGKLKPVEPSRLGIDRKTTEGWRNFSNKIHFMPVTQDTGNGPSNLDTSFILKLVEHKKKNASLIVDDLANPKEGAEKSRTCPETPKDLSAHLASRPNAGMPYGLPPLSGQQIETLKRWTEMGSPRTAPVTVLSKNEAGTLQDVEDFLNAYRTNKDPVSAKKQSLVSRYIYEHLFLGHVYLQNVKAPASFFSLIRSRTECRHPDEIATRRPWDDPKGDFLYCLKKIESAIVHKTHLPYLLDHDRIQRWKYLFFSKPWEVSFRGRPGVADVAPRDDKHASNPFLVFQDIPAKAKYQFLLDDAQYHVANFTKGPVCKGNVAVNSIDEQFYVLFLKPESDLAVRSPEFAREAIPLESLPAQKGSGQILGVGVAAAERNTRNEYRKLRDRYYGQQFPKGYTVNDIWNGQDEDGGNRQTSNPNAALTVFRHEDSAIVEKGLIGATSKTAFVLDYSIFERIYYNLVAGFDVFGDASHQVQTRLYMSYTKMEGEENFLSFMPSSVRVPMRRSWYLRSASMIEKIDSKTDLIAGHFPLLGLERDNVNQLAPLNQTVYDQLGVVQKLTVLRNYRRELISQFKKRLGPALVDNNRLNPDKSYYSKTGDLTLTDTATIADFERELTKLSDLPGLNSKWVLMMPSSAMLIVESPEGPELYTLVRNKEHLNIAWLSHEEGRRNEMMDSMVFYKGVLTSYPNYIFHVDIKDGKSFLDGMKGLRDFASYDAWTRRFGSPKNGPGSEKFWPTSDRLHQIFRAKYPLEYGAFDYNRYGTDYRYRDDEQGDLLDNLPPDLKRQVKDELGL